MVPMNCSMRRRYNKGKLEKMKADLGENFTAISLALRDEESKEFSIFEEEESEWEKEIARLEIEKEKTKKRINEIYEQAMEEERKRKERQKLAVALKRQREKEEKYGERKPCKKVKREQ